MASKIAAIVDPGEMAPMFVASFHSRGYDCMIIQTSPDGVDSVDGLADFHGLDNLRRLDRSDRAAQGEPERPPIALRHTSIERTLSLIAAYDVRCVIAGTESGVNLADRLSESLGLLTNGTALTNARRNKCLMIEAVRSHGLAVPAQVCSDRINELIDWVRLRATWPVVIKPPDSTSSEGVGLCASEHALRQAFENIKNRRNRLGSFNETAVVQEFVDGTEYIVDTVSHAGRHKAAAFWRYGKPESRPAGFIGYDSMELLPFEGPTQAVLFHYATGVLDALGIRYGPAHCELILSDKGPLLVEVGARPNGGKNALVAELCTGSAQITETINAYLEPDKFIADLQQPYRLHQNATIVFLVPERLGVLRALGPVAEIEALPSFHELLIGVKVGEPLTRVAGVVTLIHPDNAVIQRDLCRIRQIEANGFYQITPAT